MKSPKSKKQEAPKEEPVLNMPAEKILVSGPSGEFGVPSAEPMAKRGEKMVILKNLRNRPVTINLEHAVFCAAIGRCVCSERHVIRDRPIERKSKAQAPRVEKLLIPKSIRLQPMGESEPLNEAVLKCADVRTKVSSRPQKLKVIPV